MGSTITEAGTVPSSQYFSWGLANLYRKFEVTWINRFTENILGVLSIYYFVQSIFLFISGSWITGSVALFTAAFAVYTRVDIQKHTDLIRRQKDHEKLIEKSAQSTLRLQATVANLEQHSLLLNQRIETLGLQLEQIKVENTKYEEMNTEHAQLNQQNEQCIKELSSEVQRIDQVNQQLKVENIKYKEQNTEHAQLNQQNEQCIKELSSEIQRLDQFNQQHEQEVKKLSLETQTLTQIRQKHEQQIKEQSTQLLLLDQTVKEYNKLAGKLSNTAIDQKQITKDLAQINTRYEAMGELITDDIEKITEALKEFQESNITQLKLVKEQREECKTLQLQVQSLKEEQLYLTTSNERLTQVSTELEEHITYLQNFKRELEQAKEELNKTIAKNTESAEKVQGLFGFMLSFLIGSQPPAPAFQQPQTTFPSQQRLAQKV